MNQQMRELWASLRKLSELELNIRLFQTGVIIPINDAVYISGITEKEIRVGKGTIICPGVCLLGEITIGENCFLGPGTTLYNVVIGNGTSIAERPQIINAAIGKVSRIGRQTEIVRSTIGDNSALQHLSYIGDATIGNEVNIGAGTITANYDGEKKKPTIIKDGAFIGIGTHLIAPLIIGEEAFVGAGAIIRKDVKAHAAVVGLDRILSNKKGRKTPQGWKLEETA